MEAEEYHNRGIAKDDLQDYDGAIKDFSKAIEINPNFAEAYYNRGIAKANLQDYDGAIKDFSKAIEINPNFAEAYNNRGNAKANLQDYDGAIEDYNKAIEINPNYAIAYCNRGGAKVALQYYHEAIEDYNKAIEINPNLALAYCNRGGAKDALQYYHEAIEDYNKAIEINPNFADAYYNRGITKSNLQYYHEAIEDYTRAIEINPNFAEAYYNRGIAKANLQDYDGSIKDFSKAIEINPNFANAYCNRGIAKDALQYYHEAIEDYNKAIEINPNLALAYYNRGIAYEILNEKAKAITDFLTCLYLSIQQKNEKNVYDLLKELEAYPQNILYAFEELNLNIPSFSSFQLAYDKLSNFNLLLDYWENTKKITDRESLSSKALLYYYLGGNVQSFHIYDEDLDDGENPMSAQNLYYYALTAQEICYYEAQTILKDCICQLKEKVDKTDKDNYYLGHLYLLNGETKKATEQFNQSSAFHFSSIMLKEQVDKKDFSKIVLSGEIDYNKDISQFSDYFHFRECCNNNNINYTDIWEAFTFKLSFCGEINIAERKHEAEIIINELSKEYETETINWYDQLDEDNKGILKETKKHIEKLHFNLSETQQEYKIALCIIYLDKDPINASIKHYLGYVYYKFILNSLTAEALFYLISFLRCRVNDKKHDEIKKSIGNIFLSKYHYKEWINIAQGLFWSSKEDNPLKKIIDEADKNKKAYIGFRESIWKILRLDKEILSKKEFNDKWKCLYFP